MKKAHSIIPTLILVFALGACQDFNNKGILLDSEKLLNSNNSYQYIF